MDIQNQGVVFLVGQEPQGLFPGCGDPHVKTRMPQSAGNGCSDVRIVVDHEHHSTGALLRGRLSPDPHADYGVSAMPSPLVSPQRFLMSTSGWRMPVSSPFAIGLAFMYVSTSARTSSRFLPSRLVKK